MGQPSIIAGYEPEWAIIANHLKEHGNLTLPTKNRSEAYRLRFRFYGFRNALMKHDPTNPWIAVLMETQCSVDKETWAVHFERAPFAQVLRGLMEHSVVQAPQTHGSEVLATPLAEPTHGDIHGETILNILTKKP